MRLPRHWPRLARLPRLRLRTKVSVFFALLALVATVSLSTVTYTLARSSLLDQRTSAAESLAVSNARKVFDQLRAGGFTEDQKFQDIVRPEPDGFNLAHAGGTTFTADADAADAFPGALTDAVANGGSGIQRFRFGNQLYLGVGIALPAVNGDYFEAFSLASRPNARCASSCWRCRSARSSPCSSPARWACGRVAACSARCAG